MSENVIEKNNKEDVIDLLKKKSSEDISGLMKNIMKNKLEKIKNLWEVNKFFSELYDDLYYDIIFKKIKINKSTCRLLENLAMPVDRKTDNEWKKLINKILKPYK